METLRDILDHRGRKVWSGRPEDTVSHALEVLAEANAGALMVPTDAGKLVGVDEKDMVIDQLEHYISSSL